MLGWPRAQLPLRYGQMPLNILDAHFRSFAHLVVPKLVEQGIGVLGMKPMAFGNIPQKGLATGIECLHYALNLPTSVVITGCDSMERLQQALEAARTFRPLTEAQIASLLEKTRSASISGEYEKFKTVRSTTAPRPTRSGWGELR